MANSRQVVLKNIRSALNHALLPAAAPQQPKIDFPGSAGGLERFSTELEKLSGEVHRVSTLTEAYPLLLRILKERGWKQTLIWEQLLQDHPGLRNILAEAAIETHTAGELDELAKIFVGITGAQATIADTGTVVLQNTPGQPSFVSLLPEVHIVLLSAAVLYPNLQAYLSGVKNIGEKVRESSNLTFVTGPSRTGDIELSLTLGVHGPREVIVIVWEKE